MRTIWLLGGERSGFDQLEQTFTECGGVKVERIGEQAALEWLERVRAGELGSPLPNLLVVDAELAWRDDALLLRTVAENEPWASLPLVVVSRDEDEERCARSYEMGAAGWVVLPRDDEQADHAARAFATYWSKTTLLPIISPRAGGHTLSRTWTH